MRKDSQGKITGNETSNISEIEGYLDLGMDEEASKLAKSILLKSSITAKEFSAAMDAVGFLVENNPHVEAAYWRLHHRERKLVSVDMLWFYYWQGDYENAARFLDLKSPQTVHELCIAMDIFTSQDRIGAAKAVAKRCENILMDRPFEQDDRWLFKNLKSVYHKLGMKKDEKRVKQLLRELA